MKKVNDSAEEMKEKAKKKLRGAKNLVKGASMKESKVTKVKKTVAMRKVKTVAISATDHADLYEKSTGKKARKAPKGDVPKLQKVATLEIPPGITHMTRRIWFDDKVVREEVNCPGQTITAVGPQGTDLQRKAWGCELESSKHQLEGNCGDRGIAYEEEGRPSLNQIEGEEEFEPSVERGIILEKLVTKLTKRQGGGDSIGAEEGVKKTGAIKAREVKSRLGRKRKKPGKVGTASFMSEEESSSEEEETEARGLEEKEENSLKESCRTEMLELNEQDSIGEQLLWSAPILTLDNELESSSLQCALINEATPKKKAPTGTDSPNVVLSRRSL